MRSTITTRRDLRNWVDTSTTNWDDRTDEQVDQITDSIRGMDHPAWGTDWTEFLSELPDDLTEMLAAR